SFLEHTRLDKLRPEADLSLTVPGRYGTLEEHIEVHRYFMGLEQQREIPYEEAVTHWYDTVYLPVVEVIQERGI
ncbi:MAG: transcriptional regulator, partial [Anaerolineae bacterium]|nr:transcriptional regulator [Anaerolineae bacterium]NIN99752.1 transcriptional regulator [Anaerolineae bacterium]NIQ82584.1 transcriptional regulator [Anaerolineae bacterium]